MSKNKGNVRKSKKNRKLFSSVRLLVLLGIIINQIGNIIVFYFKLPIYLDVVGTIIVGILAGPWVAAITGLLTNVLSSLIIDTTALPYGLVNAAIGIAAGLLAQKSWFNNWWKALSSGFILAITTTIAAALIDMRFFGKVIGSNIELVCDLFSSTSNEVCETIFNAGILTDVDKVISAFIAFIIVKNLPKKYINPFKKR